MFSTRHEYARVIALLLTRLATDEPAPGTVDVDAAGDPRVRWTADELAAADGFVLDVTERPPPGASLELVLRRDLGWTPAVQEGP